MRERLSTGIPGLDFILGGGIPFGYSWLVEGDNGIGKTTLGLQYAHAIETLPAERALYVSFIELPEELHRFARNFGWDLKALEEAGRLKLLAISPDVFLKELLGGGGMVRQLLEEFMPSRLVLDSVTDLRLNLKSEGDFRHVLEALLNLFRRRRITSLLIQDTGPDNPPSALIRRVADVTMRMDWQPVGDGSLMDRAFTVSKVRGVDHYNSYVLFEIGEHGLVAVPPDYETFPRKPLETIDHLQPSRVAGGFSTGLAELDRLVGGGLPYQSTWLYNFDVNSYYPDIYMPLFAQALADGATTFFLRSGRHTFQEAHRLITPYGFNYEGLVGEARLVIGDLFEQSPPSELSAAVVAARRDQSPESYADAVVQRVHGMLAANAGRPHLSMMSTNALVRRFGSHGLLTFIDRVIGATNQPEVTHVFLSNHEELRPTDQAFLGFMARGIIRCWKNDGYQYLQVAKTPRNSSSPPCILIRQAHFPYLKLLVRR